MRVGTICYATSRGLGHLAKAFYDHGIITDVCVVRHPSVPTHEDWYPDAPVTDLRRLDTGLLQDFVIGLDALLCFETPFWWHIFDHCRDVGVRSYLCVMHECHPVHAREPHKYLCPSLLDLEYFPSGVYLPLPVEYPWRLRTKAEHYVHNGGYLGIRGREGTTLLIEAMQFVRSPLRLTIRVQENVDQEHQEMAARDGRIDYRAGTVPYEELYATGDVCVGAQKWNGCSLPLMEARASGMLVMNSDRFPMNVWLPREPLIPVSRYEASRISGAYLPFQEAIVHPKDIAETMDKWYGRDITAYSLQGKAWAEEHSWDALGAKWREVLER